MDLTDLEQSIILCLAQKGPNTSGTIAECIGAHKKSVARSVSGGDSYNSLSDRGLTCNKGAGVYTLTVEGWDLARRLDDSVKIPQTDTYECSDSGRLIYL